MENVDKIKNACNELYCLVYDEVKKHYYCPDEVVKEAFVKVDELIAELESKSRLENDKYTFKVYSCKNGKCHERTHHCSTIDEAKQQLVGMVYSMFFSYKHPIGELWQDGKMIYRIN